MLLHAAAQFRDQPLPFLGKQLGKRERRDALDDGGRKHRADQRRQQADLVLADDVIEQKFCGPRQDKAAQPVDDHQHEAERELRLPRPNQIPEQRPAAFQMIAGLPLGFPRRHTTSSSSMCMVPHHFAPAVRAVPNRSRNTPGTSLGCFTAITSKPAALPLAIPAAESSNTSARFTPSRSAASRYGSGAGLCRVTISPPTIVSK